MVDFELHLTTRSLDEIDIISFSSVCQTLSTKPLLIELARGEHCQQPMATAHFQGESNKVLAFASDLANRFEVLGFPIQRMKVEVPLLALPINTVLSSNGVCYFEWHGKLKLHHKSDLLKLCEQYRSHLSRNAIRGENDLRFVSIRQAVGEKQVFIDFVNRFVNDLMANGWPIIDQQFEHCIYDNNNWLDEGWL